MIGRARLSLLLLLLAALLSGGCVVVPDDSGDDLPSSRWEGPPPGPQQVRQASAWLDDAIARRFKKSGWPKYLPRSRDFPDLPLVKLEPVQDMGAWGVDTAALTKTLEQSVREHFSLRFLADEVAVPGFLREGKDGDQPQAPKSKKPPHAGLVLKAWAAEDGRFYIDLRDTIHHKSLITVRSRQPGGF